VVDGEVVRLNDGDWIRLPKDTPRQIRNPGANGDAVWLTIGAPPGEGMTDGIRLDPATGEDIPRAS
jgi:mannose-6-phosphate isomerase-like protein (cupin superfamily)